MVTIEEIQAAYYMVAATGVLVAAVFYMFNLRETMRNRRATFNNNVWQAVENTEWQKVFIEVLNMQWTDFEDFKKRYDSSASVENYSKRQTVFLNFDSLGRQLRQGLIDVDSLGDAWAFGIVALWNKFKPIIKAYRDWQYPKNLYRDFEYLAGVLEKKLILEDPDFIKKMNTFFTTPVSSQ